MATLCIFNEPNVYLLLQVEIKAEQRKGRRDNIQCITRTHWVHGTKLAYLGVNSRTLTGVNVPVSSGQSHAKKPHIEAFWNKNVRIFSGYSRWEEIRRSERSFLQHCTPFFAVVGKQYITNASTRIDKCIGRSNRDVIATHG